MLSIDQFSLPNLLAGNNLLPELLQDHVDSDNIIRALDEIEKRICPGLIISLTRIEPPLHPDGPEKILKDFGIEPEELQEEELSNFFDRNE